MTPRSWLPGRARALALLFALDALAPRARADEPAAAPATASGAAAGAVPPGDAAAAPPDAAASAPPNAAAAAPPDADSPFVDEIVVLGKRPRAEVAADPTASATVVSAERYAGEAKDVAQLVATAPGVAVNEYGGIGQLSTVSIRGSTSSGVLVLLDGLTLNTAAGGGVDLSTIPRSWISRVEVVRGAEGARYGAGPLGGVVNVVTAAPRAGEWEVESHGGSFGTFGAAAEHARGGGGWTILSQLELERTDGRFPFERSRTPNLPGTAVLDVRDNNGALRGGGLVKLVTTVGDRRLDALVQVTGGRRELPGWPFTSSADWQRDGRAVASARLALPMREGVTLAARTHVRAELLDLRLEDLGGSVSRQRGASAGAEVEGLWDHHLGTLRATAGGEAEALSTTALGGTRTRPSAHASAAEDLSLASGRFTMAPALRADAVGPFFGVSGKLGASWRLARALAIKASAGRSFRPPSIAELFLEQGLVMPNPALLPEQGLGADAGVVYDGPAGLLSVGGHATLYRELIHYEATSFGRLKPRNAGKALLRGIEAEAATPPLRRALGLAVSASYTLLMSENLRGDPEVVGNDLTFRPRHRLYARASVAPGPAGVHVEVHWVGAQFEDIRNRYVVPAAIVWNAGASLRVLRRPRVAVHAEVRNLLDDRTLLEPLGGPLPGRMVMVTLRVGSPALQETEGRP